MDQETDKQSSVLRNLDWWTICIYLALLVFGWISVCGASYTYGETDILALAHVRACKLYGLARHWL